MSPGRWMRHIVPVLLAALATLGGCRSDSKTAPPEPSETTPPVVLIAAAADLSLAFEELGKEFTKASGTVARFSFGSTGLLASQLKHGAPFDLFAAASAAIIDDVAATGACDAATKQPYARGRIVVWSKKGLVTPPATLAELADARFKRVSIANPKHAPYGLRRARRSRQPASGRASSRGSCTVRT